MANIPGISGYIQPGAFARDRVISKAASIPGGLRIAAIMGEGIREEVIVESAAGSGQDGTAVCSPTGSGDGRFFRLANHPVVAGRTEVTLNGVQLYGVEDEIDEAGFSSKYDFRIDPITGCIELQAPSIKDQNGLGYSVSSLNIGNGTIIDTLSDTCNPLEVIDSSAPAERWTLKCVSVVRDSTGAPIPGRATFSAVGSVSGQMYDQSGNPLFFHSTYFTSNNGAVSGNIDTCTDAYTVASSVDFAQGTPIADGGETLDTTDTFEFIGDLVSQGQALPGDYLCVDGYTSAEIDSISYDSGLNTTTIKLTTDSLNGVGVLSDWEIRATNLFIDDVITGSFTGSDIGKIILACPTPSFGGGKYTITKVTANNRVRVQKYGDETVAFPAQSGIGATGIAHDGITFHLVEANGIIQIGIEEGVIPFEVGDRLFVDVASRSLAFGDKLVAKYIYEADLNDPQFFTDAELLFAKHGLPSEANTLSLGAQMAFENGAPGIMAVQCKPAIPRRTTAQLLSTINSLGVGGFTGCLNGSGIVDSDLCGVEDLRFIIPRPISGLRSGRPDADSRVNIFVNRAGVETQIFPNKVNFYNSQLETDSQQLSFITSTDNPFSYTVVNTDTEILFTAEDGILLNETGGRTLSSLFLNLDASHTGSTIVIESMEDLAGTVYTSLSDISEQLYGVLVTESAEVVINTVTSDTKAVISGSGVNTLTFTNKFVNIQFFVKSTNITNVSAALLLHKDLVKSGAIQKGDGIRITYIDEKDADYFDTNWFTAFEKLESADAQIIVPLPTSATSSIFKAAVSHCENMSSIANRKERVAIIGAQTGLTPAKILGESLAAVEDLGVLEGIQGDDPLEILVGDVEDLANYKLSDNYNSTRAIYLYPDAIVRNISGTNISLPGFFMAPAAAGLMSATQNVSIPLTNKVLQGFTLTRDKIFRPLILDRLGGEGATVIQPIPGGGKVLAGRTTSHSGYVEDEEISIVFIRDRVKQVLRQSLASFIGGVQGPDTLSLISARTKGIMTGLASQGLITSFGNIRASRDKVDPRQINIFLQFVPAYPINFVFIDIEVGVI
jgi:hypothetical protein